MVNLKLSLPEQQLPPIYIVNKINTLGDHVKCWTDIDNIKSELNCIQLTSAEDSDVSGSVVFCSS